MKNISYGLAAVFGWGVLINDTNAETWGKFETDSLRIEKKDTQNTAVISDNLFDEDIKDEQPINEKKKVSKKSPSVKRKNKRHKKKKR